MTGLKIFSFFSGSGFLDLGFEKAGYKIEFVNEFSEAFLNAYKYSRKKMKMVYPKYGYGNTDVTQYLHSKKDELEQYIKDARLDGSMIGFIGGPPCPDFSVAGKQRGREGENGKLSQTYIDLIISQQPDFFLFENVKGLWRTAKHRAFFEELKKQLQKAGYRTTERLTNSIEFGAPQDRDRILMIGIKDSLYKEPGKTVIDDFEWLRNAVYDVENVKGLNWPKTSEFVENAPSIRPENIPVDLTVEYWFRKNDVENHPNAHDYFHPRAGIDKMRVVEEGDDSKKSYKRLHRWRYSPTVCYGNNEVHLHPYKIRRLSAAEAMALQSLPAEFELPPEMTLTDKFKTIGNGVPFALSYGIAKTLKQYLDEAISNGKINSI